MSLRNGVLPSPTLAVWSFAAVLLLAAGSLPLQAQEYTPLPRVEGIRRPRSIFVLLSRAMYQSFELEH